MAVEKLATKRLLIEGLPEEKLPDETILPRRLPPEVWQLILINLKFIELVKLRRVSTMFNDLTRIIMRTEDRWYWACVNDIPEKYWRVLMRHRFDVPIHGMNFHVYKKESIIWRKMYKVWIASHSIIYKEPSKRSIVFPVINGPPRAQHPRIRITCMDVLNNILAIGDNNGRLLNYDYWKPKNAPHIDHFPELSVKEVAICRCGDSDNHVKSLVNAGDPQPVFRNVISPRLRQRFIESYTGSRLSTNFEYCCTVIEEEHNVILKVGELKDDDIEFFRFYPVACEPCERIVAIYMNGEEVTLLTVNYDIGSSRFYQLKDGNSHVHDSVPCDNVPHEYKFLDSSVAVRFNHSPNSRIAFSVRGRNWKFFEPKSDFHLNADVASVYYYVDMLLFGLISGEVVIIHVGDIKNVENFDSKMLKEAKRKNIKLDTVPIKFVDVSERQANHLYILAATNQKVHIVKFK